MPIGTNVNTYNGCHDNECPEATFDICSAMPVTDVFNTPDATDSFFMLRRFVVPDCCGRPRTTCQPVTVSMAEFTRLIAEGNVSTLCTDVGGLIDNGNRVGG